jgi:hypothetical protein
MVEVVLGMFGVSMAGLWATLWTVKMRVEAQTQALVGAVGLLEDLNDVASSLAEAPDATAEVIETISNMHVPTGQDHIMSAAASLLQMWGMSKWGGGGSLSQLLGMPVGAEPPEAEPSYPPS